jgi:hypothetical protein
VTSLTGGRAKGLYERVYCRRGEAENHIKVRIPTKSAGGSDFMSAPDSDRSRPGVALAFWLV